MRAIHIKGEAKKLVIKRGKSAVVTVTVKGENNEPCANHTVYASAENKKVSIDESTETNENGKAKFTIVAGDERGRTSLLLVHRKTMPELQIKLV